MLELKKMYKTIAAGIITAVITTGTMAFTGVGTPTSASEVAPWDISVFYDGENLPEGRGNINDGEELYNARCAMCHGDFGEGANKYPKILGADVEDMISAGMDGENNVTMRGINNFWGHAPTLFDTIKRAMPYFAPQSLSNEQTYAITGYVLSLAEVLPEDVEYIDAELLKSIKLPGRDIFVSDNRPDTNNTRCMTDCLKGDVKYLYNVLADDD